MRIYITGIGLITAVGKDPKENLASVRALSSGVRPIRLLDTAHRNEMPLAEVLLDNEQLGRLAGISGAAGDYSRTMLLGLVAARQALDGAGIKDVEGMGMVGATSVGGMDRSERFYEAFLKNADLEQVRVLLGHECGAATERIADELGISGLVTTVSTACSSSANAIMTGARLLKHGLLDRVLVGGSDAMTRFTLNGFDTLKILDHDHCQPFDRERRGLNLGEGAAFLVLETERTAAPERRLACLSGYANMNDAYHQTASSPDGQGAFLAMQKALQIAGLQPQDIDYINAHGTGTLNNDLSEGRAILQLFGAQPPRFSSTKAFTGHTLGAAGAVEAALSVLSIQYGLVYPNLRFRQTMDELPLRPQTELLEGLPIRHVLSNSFGFGGNSTALVFSQA